MFFYFCHLDGGIYSGLDACGIGEIFTGDIEGGAVSGRCSDYGQAYSDIYRILEGKQLYGYHCLIVVHRDYGIKASSYGL